MSILITGGTGFIGLHTSRAFLEHGFDVVSTQFRVRRELADVEQHRANRFHREVVDVTSDYALDALFEKHAAGARRRSAWRSRRRASADHRRRKTIGRT